MRRTIFFLIAVLFSLGSIFGESQFSSSDTSNSSQNIGSGITIKIKDDSIPSESLRVKNSIREIFQSEKAFSIIDPDLGESQKQFLFNVPKGSLGVKIVIRRAETDLSLIASFGRLEDPFASVKIVETPSWDEVLIWDKINDSNFREGALLLTVKSPKVLSEKISFLIEAEAVSPPRFKILQPGRNFKFRLTENNLFFDVFKLAVSSDAIPLLFKWQAELGKPELLLRYGQPAWRRGEADYSFTLGSREQEFLLGSIEGEILKRGDWYISIISKERASFGGIEANFIKKTPIKLVPLTSLPQSQGNELEGCMSAVVGVTTVYGTSVGAFVSEKGHLITSLSGISDKDGKIAEDFSLLVSPSIEEAPLYSFKAILIQSDKKLDLALLKVSSAAHNKPIALGMRFPFIEIADQMRLETGQPISIMGFPLDKRKGTSGSVFVLNGIVAGFERSLENRWFKANSLPGGSSGIVVNIYHQLVGVGSFSSSLKVSVISIYSPVYTIPFEWKILLK